MQIDWQDAEYVMREADVLLPRPVADALTDLFRAMAGLRYDPNTRTPSLGSLEVRAALKQLRDVVTAERESA